MNFSLHLQTIFTFVKTKQNNFKEKNPIHIYKNCTRHCLVMYLNSTTVDLFWLKGVLETVHAHIHIYIYQGPWSCQKLQKQVFCLFLMVVIFFSWVISDRSAPTSTAPSQPLQLSFWLLPSGCYTGWGKSTHGRKHVSGMPLLYPFILTSHSVL